MIEPGTVVAKSVCPFCYALGDIVEVDVFTGKTPGALLKIKCPKCGSWDTGQSKISYQIKSNYEKANDNGTTETEQESSTETDSQGEVSKRGQSQLNEEPGSGQADAIPADHTGDGPGNCPSEREDGPEPEPKPANDAREPENHGFFGKRRARSGN